MRADIYVCPYVPEWVRECACVSMPDAPNVPECVCVCDCDGGGDLDHRRQRESPRTKRVKSWTGMQGSNQCRAERKGGERDNLPEVQ